MRLDGAPVPRPDYWGGYRVVPHNLEFWQGRLDRLHDRFVYTREGHEWKKARLEP
jgi:pyridoxamine 5'-phosphate oxidase